MFFDEKLRFESPIAVTRPTLPPLEDYVSLLVRIWSDHHLTNHGPYSEKFESNLQVVLGSNYCRVTNCGTTALIAGLAGTGVSGQIVVPPFSFAGTFHALHWCGLEPVFADIEVDGWGIDPSAVESAISHEVEGILGVHIFGFPVQTYSLEKISERYGLSLGYDAAHAMGVNLKGKSLPSYGNWSALSFHATKLMNSIEGGAVVTSSEEIANQVNLIRDFGFDESDDVLLPGLNGKMNEFEAAMGLLQLQQLENEIEVREKLYTQYVEGLKEIPGLIIPEPPFECRWNFAYAPIRIRESQFGADRDRLFKCLKNHGVNARKYFTPLGTDLPWYKEKLGLKKEQFPNATKAAEETLALPLFSLLPANSCGQIIEIIRGFHSSL